MSAPTLFFWIYTGALLLLWIYIASSFGRDVFYNLYVNRARTLLYKPVTWVQSIAPRCARSRCRSNVCRSLNSLFSSKRNAFAEANKRTAERIFSTRAFKARYMRSCSI